MDNKKLNKKYIGLGCYIIWIEKKKNIKLVCYICSG